MAVFGIPYLEYIGGIGIVAAVIVLWYFLSRRGNDRIGAVKEMEREDLGIANIDERIVKDEKDEKKQARVLMGLMMNIHARAQTIGMDLKDRYVYLNQIIEGLDMLQREKMNSGDARNILNQVNLLMDQYFEGFNSTDSQLIGWTADVRDARQKLFAELQDENNLLGVEAEELRKMYARLRRTMGR